MLAREKSVKEFEASIENLRSDAAEVALARDSVADESQRKVYDLLYEHFIRLADELEQAVKSAEDRYRQTLCDERAAAIGADPETLAIVILPQEKGDLTFKVCLMELDRNGEIEWDARKLVLTRTAGLDGAKNYSMDLSDMLKMKVLQAW
jgi:lysine/ornithine N-monooxygenase